MTCILLDTASDISLNKSAQCSSFPITRVCSTGVVLLTNHSISTWKNAIIIREDIITPSIAMRGNRVGKNKISGIEIT
ncbi:hypothetical protein SDC9_208242 [bioreactor metagenome]|uniref:Uncharacterized protein n=1 Tax=bioreactor metagenome TaxID=1076179 RepID=A0A645JJJ9_9ZZZZ